MKAILKNLKDQILTNDNTIMYCPICESQYSANSGDYYMINDENYEFKCCEETMLLGEMQTCFKGR